LELWVGLSLVALFFYLYIKGRKQYQGMRDRRRKILNRYREIEAGDEEDNKGSKD